MRFYDIVISKDGNVFTPPSMQGMGGAFGGVRPKVSYSSLIDGRRPNPSALDLYVNIPAYFISAPRQGAMVRLSGISLEDIAAITHLADHDIEVYGGMLDGYLPLSKHFSPDLLIKGVIWYTSGNWEPGSTTLEMVITTPTTRNPALNNRPNLGFNWPVGTPLKPALQKFIEQSYGKSASNPTGASIQIDISPDLVARSQFAGNYVDLTEFGQALKKFTQDSFRTIKRLDNAPYRGVEMFWRNNTIYAVDGTVPPTQGSSTHTQSDPLVIDFVDIIGQPVWKSLNGMVFKTIMRGDISLADYVKLPQGLSAPYVLTGTGTGQAPNDPNGITLPSKQTLGFSGTFQVQEICHQGQFRQANGMSWVTVVDCFTTISTTSTEPLTPAATNHSGAVQSTEPPPGSIPNPANPLNTTPPPTPQGPLGGGGV